MKTTVWLMAMMIAALGGIVAAQAPAAPSSPQAAQMKKLAFLAGKWQGEGTIEFVPGQRDTFAETETIEPKLDGLAYLIQGRGTSAMPGGRRVVTHSALAVVSYDLRSQSFQWQAYNLAGPTLQSVATTATVGDRTLEWGYSAGPMGTFRFTIRMTANGDWSEVGTIAQGGQPPRQFFEMHLHRVKGRAGR